jgi:hypothetical protein
MLRMSEEAPDSNLHDGGIYHGIGMFSEKRELISISNVSDYSFQLLKRVIDI